MIANKDKARSDSRLKLYILKAARDLSRKKGWEAMTMRKIGQMVGCSPTLIYEHFANKHAILNEFVKEGFGILIRKMTDSSKTYSQPARKLKAMWLEYWKFASTDTDLYQLMFGVKIVKPDEENLIKELARLQELVSEPLMSLLNKGNSQDRLILKAYYSMWSSVHGLISLGIIGQHIPSDMRNDILKESMDRVISLVH